MKSASDPPSFFVGWDVGGWNCDNNSKSRDAIVILDERTHIVGKPWRGNLRNLMSASESTAEWLKALFELCGEPLPSPSPSVTMAIDTPLGFSTEFTRLITGVGHVEPDEVSGRNCYLFRQTERAIFDGGKQPLSAIKDMIGSQATKGMHSLSKFASTIESCGVWTDGRGFRAIETYPAACGDHPIVQRLLGGASSLGHHDKDDARICAIVASLFARERHELEPPSAGVPKSEGWIWIPRQAQ